MNASTLRRSLLAAVFVVVVALVAGVSATASPPDSKPPRTAALRNALLFGFDRLEFGQFVNGRLKKLGDNGTTTDIVTFPDMTVRWPQPEHLVLYLRDLSCGRIYFSDGTGDANHVNITSFGTYDHLGMADAAGLPDCRLATEDYFTGGNFQADVYPAGMVAPGAFGNP